MPGTYGSGHFITYSPSFHLPFWSKFCLSFFSIEKYGIEIPIISMTISHFAAVISGNKMIPTIENTIATMPIGSIILP